MWPASVDTTDFPTTPAKPKPVPGDTSIIGGYYKDLTDRIVQALVSPEAYYEQIAKPQIMNENMKGGQVQADYTKSPVALNDYNVVNNEDMTKVMRKIIEIIQLDMSDGQKKEILKQF